MPFSVEHLIEGRPFPVTVTQETAVSEALSVMIEHDFSQLPVIDADNHPLGIITYEGILRGVRNFQAQIEDLHVRDVYVTVSQAHLEDDLFELLERLRPANAVLIVDSTRTLIDIITSSDTTEYFRGRAEDLMRVEDIETSIKDLIIQAYYDENGELDEASLDKAISRITQHEKGQKEKTFDDLALAQYISLLVSRDKWPFFEPIFKVSRESVRKLLDAVRLTRNSLAHFRNEITASQTDQLRFCAEWLARCSEEYEKLKSKDSPTFNEQEAPLKQIVETDSAVDSTDSSLQNLQPVSIIAEETKPRESRYTPLIDWLQSQPGRINQVKRSFKEIEAIIGGNLPASAYTHRAWWANDSHSHQHSRMWLEVGWRRTHLNMTEGQVTFVRIREREKAYIEFFSQLLAELRTKPSFPYREVSPDGASWLVAQTITKPRSVFSQFNFSFSRDRHLRVELYIDADDKHTVKQIFDHIHTQKEFLEGELGQMSWERIDDKRASRIAIYHPGTILDDLQTLNRLKSWAADKMAVFYQAIEPLAVKAIQEVLKT